MRTINPMIAASNYEWSNFDIDNIVTVLQQTAFLGLNPSATPRECYYIVRKNYDNKEKKWLAPTLEFGVEGAGNDIILQKFGRDVKEIKSYIVYQGDEFTVGYFNGFDVVLPKYTRTFKTNIPEKAVYLIKKINGEIDVQYSDTDDVKKSLLANAKQNGADDKLLRELNKRKLYDLLEDEKLLDTKIKKEYKGNSYETPLFNPSYTSPISQYNMIERKLRNHATRKYPKNFDNKAVTELYEETFDERQAVIEQQVSAEERLSNSQEDFEKNSGKDKVITTVKKEDVRPTLEVKVEEPIIEKEVEQDIVIEEEAVEEPQTQEQEVVNDNDIPDWAR
jgi:hypothetical protein